MKKRILVAAVGVPFLRLVFIWAPAWATMLLLAALCGVGAHELMHAVMGENGKRVLKPLTVLTAALVPVLIYGDHAIWETQNEKLRLGQIAGYPESASLVLLAAAFFLLGLFLYAILHYGKESAIPFADVTAAIFAGLIFPAMLSGLLRLRLMDNGTVQVFVPLAVSFGSDTFAYFTGLACGKHKLAPHVSPKKTVEGSVGGLIGGVAGMLLVKWIGEALTSFTIGYGLVIVIGLLGAAVSQVGDLSFSVIKREFGVKDYGKLLPGHGGVLDRFDSVTFVTPFIWLALSFWR